MTPARHRRCTTDGWAGTPSLLGVGGALGLAGQQRGPGRILLIGLAVVTVVGSWTVVNTVYTLHYAHRALGSTTPGIAFGDAAGQERPAYRDFATSLSPSA